MIGFINPTQVEMVEMCASNSLLRMALSPPLGTEIDMAVDYFEVIVCFLLSSPRLNVFVFVFITKHNHFLQGKCPGRERSTG